MLTIKQLISECGGQEAIRARSSDYSPEPIRDTSTIRYWMTRGVPPKWYQLVADLSGRSIAEVHTVSEAARRKQPLAQAS